MTFSYNQLRRMPSAGEGSLNVRPVQRIRLLYGLVVGIFALFGLRLFYIQVIRYDYYKQAALSDQLKQYQIPATRGIIEAHDGDSIVPIVLNQQLYTLYADPVYITNPSQVAEQLAPIVGGDASADASAMRTPDTRYVVLAKQLTNDQSNRILALKIPGIGTQGQEYRTYPQGALAAQLLGFVDNDGVGQYGLEQAMNQQLAGIPGQVKAVTDVNGVPLAASPGNVQIAPVNGENIVTTLDISMQSQMEQILANEAKKTHTQLLSAVILDATNGDIKAMANYPTYDPANYQDVTDPSVFQNAVVSNAIEPGSIMKTLTTPAAIDQGAVQADTSFYDPAQWTVDGFTIRDIEEDGGAREQTIQSLLSLSLNTGATWLLMQMSQPGGTQITQKGIDAWYNYMVNHYRLGMYTGVEQGYESPGLVPADNPSAPAEALTFANTSFGQGVLITPLQMAAAFTSVVNGGTYYQPTLIDQTVASDGTTKTQLPKVVERDVVKPSTTAAMLPLLEGVVVHYAGLGFGYMNFPSSYIVGGKTGTAQIANPAGGYYSDKYNGTYVGFVGGDHPQYVICVYNIEPQVVGYAGAQAGQPVFADLAHMLINNSFVTPKS